MTKICTKMIKMSKKNCNNFVLIYKNVTPMNSGRKV